jgi:hypothetical protein
MMSTYDTPSTRAEFEERMNYMCEILKQGKMHFSREVGGVDSLLTVRYLPNRRIDLLSIDESARLQANTSYHMRNMNFEGLQSDGEDK